MVFSATLIRRKGRYVGTLAGVAAGVVLGMAAPAHAQYSTSAEVLESPGETSNDLFRAGEDSLRTPFDLYHRANLANTRTPEEFLQQQRSVLGSEIENLRMQQMQLIQGQPSQSAPVPEAASDELPVVP